jgi:hypothetical protein
MLQSLYLLVRDSLVFPLPLLALAAFAFARVRDRALRVVAAFGIVFFGLWFAMQPSLYPRFSLLFAPVALLGLGVGLSALKPPLPRRAAQAGLAVLLVAFIALSGYYSVDAARYVAGGDLERYHQATWFWPVYRWADAATPPSSRFLVIVQSGHSYYLDRPYRRADPFLSGVVDWEGVRTPVALDSVLARGRYDYVIYHRSDWAKYPGGREMMAVIDRSVREGDLVVVRSFDLRLVESRLKGTSVPATVWVLARRGTAAARTGAVTRPPRRSS